MNKNVTLRRIAAGLVDWSILCLVYFVCRRYLYITDWRAALLRPSMRNIGPVLLLFFLVVLVFAIFVFRDVIFKGRSMGKRVFALCVIDKTTDENASVEKKIIRNAFFFLCLVDVFILIITKETIGDRMAGTTVIRKQKEK